MCYKDNPATLKQMCGEEWSKIGLKSYKQLQEMFGGGFAANGGTTNY